MNIRLLSLFSMLLAALTLSACGGSSNNDPEPTPPGNGDPGDDDIEVPTSYSFPDSDDVETVSYTGQTKRHVLIDDLVVAISELSEGPGQTVVNDLNFYFRFDGTTSDDVTTRFNERHLDGMDILPQDSGELTYGAISSGKNLVGKIAGGDGEGGGETGTLINDEFFGWETGLEEGARPVDLVDYFFARLETEATDGDTPQIDTVGGPVALDTVTVDAWGLDYRQLVQKFLLGAVTFSQGTNDYLQADFANMLELEGDNAYTEGEHNWDEAFGYFGAARDYGDYTIDEIRNIGYKDSDEDGAIDIRSEFNFGNSTNCAKRDAGTADNSNPTDFTGEAFEAFLTGRAILRAAAEAGELDDELAGDLDEQIAQAALVWEQCVAATVVHYINDVVADMDDFENGQFQDLAHFKNLAKHWGEMKGFALGLQFSPESPFRADDQALMNLKQVLSLMGDAPVLADGTQGGEAFEGGVDQYRGDLLEARDLMEAAYEFDSENVENW